MTTKDSALTLARIPADFLIEEPALSETKWFDYRYMSAADATRVFLWEYVAVYREWWSRLVDSSTAPHQAPVREHDLFANNNYTLSALWRARQMADVAGMPYQFYLWRAFEFLCGGAPREKLPRPNQLYTSSVFGYALQRWDEQKAVETFPVQIADIRFLTENYRGDAPQDALHDRVLEHLKSKCGSDLTDALRRMIHNRQMLPEARARLAFGDDVVDQVKPDTDRYQLPTSGDLEPFRPSCFGSPGSLDESSSHCRLCPSRTSCASEVVAVEQMVMMEHGNSDPRHERKTMLARERQRRKRKLTKAKKAAA